MAATANKSKAGESRVSHEPGIPTIRFAGVVDRTAELSGEVLTSLEKGERAAIEAVQEFIITLEEELPHEVVGTSEVARTITRSGTEMVDRLVHTQYTLLRNIVDSTAKSLIRHDGAQVKAA
ncbi:MAG: hypothetical protein ACXVEW_09785 [Solirubrobacteraceae bacterium]